MSKKIDSAKEKTLSSDPHANASDNSGWRETVESILMAIVLALLFRGFVAEAFVIPTGSMAPTLFGRHRDVLCPQCAGNFRYQASASSEVDENGRPDGPPIISATCPNCRFSKYLDPEIDPNEASFSGDRIIVSKFIYDFQQPKRWDVIVFKYPGDATKNYIKRLIGLPNETIRITGGNIYVRPAGTEVSEAHIARKPPKKLNTLLQLVHDTENMPQLLIDLGWPSRWSEAPSDDGGDPVWKTTDGGRVFAAQAPQGRTSWLNYRNRTAGWSDWWEMSVEHKLPAAVEKRPGELITDFYGYNTSSAGRNDVDLPDPAVSDLGFPPYPTDEGMHWVDDLAVEFDARIESAEGALVLALVRAGEKFLCRIDVATGEAVLTRTLADGAPGEFASDDGKTVAKQSKASTNVRGPSRHTLRLSNCDHEVLLWVDGDVVAFDGPTTYKTDEKPVPVWSKEETGDLEPARIGAEGIKVNVSKMKIYRDKYYIATDNQSELNDYKNDPGPLKILDIYADPTTWQTTGLFDPENRRAVEFTMADDQFFPLGDNSPHSSDARMWGPPPHVNRDLLIGKALFIYWPHTWNRPIPFWPNFSRMGPIH